MLKNKFFVDFEKKNLLSLVRSYSRSRKAAIRVLDVGCGFGRNIEVLEALEGVDVVGVDVNVEALAFNRAKGRSIFHPEDDGWKRKYDVIVMSHIIEHFLPEDLVNFMDGYLDFLKEGGRLIIATPLLSSYFYDDFTHVKPYVPESLLMIYGSVNPQVSINSNHCLDLASLWFRRSPFKIRRVRMRYLGGLGGKAIALINGGLALVFSLSFGLVGAKDGWLGMFVYRSKD